MRAQTSPYFGSNPTKASLLHLPLSLLLIKHSEIKVEDLWPGVRTATRGFATSSLLNTAECQRLPREVREDGTLTLYSLNSLPISAICFHYEK